MARNKKIVYPLSMTQLDYAALKVIAADRDITNAEAIRRLIREAFLRDCPNVLNDSTDGFSKADTTANAEFYAS